MGASKIQIRVRIVENLCFCFFRQDNMGVSKIRSRIRIERI